MVIKITSLDQLKKEAEEGAEFFILLGNQGLLRSSKWIVWESEIGIFFVRNLIDDTEQELNERQIMDRGYTNIGYAMLKGALFKDDRL
jgi:hypothetical protein